MPPTPRISGRPRRTPLRAALATGIALTAALAATAPAGTATAADPDAADRRTQRVEYFTGPGAHPRHAE
ncbi:hypothetical protein GKQ77_15105, partial [Streptomyces sp. BG9H]|nr:hypothetical protein [Streptomyces anatolicus]